MESSAPSTQEDPGKLPKTFVAFARRFPELAKAHQEVGETVSGLGPLDVKTQSLVKIGICLGGGLESALRSHVRRALRAGASFAEVEQAIMLGMNTCGFPRTVAAWQWACQQAERDGVEQRPEGGTAG